MQREITRGQREDSPLGVVLLDLDHFKIINDSYGHIAGDAVLREAARRMLNSIRSYDSIGRYGGEEFLLLLPGCDQASTEEKAERLRAYLCAEPLFLTETSITLTASFGATTAFVGMEATIEDLIRTADEALYRAKKLGRNRVEFLSARGASAQASAAAFKQLAS
jgi:diguanylate cyclase (GGDEF)-like protein